MSELTNSTLPSSCGSQENVVLGLWGLVYKTFRWDLG